ncbi:MAG: hypothetical protein M3525_13355 [Acidobacteriota bacterium]|nr:hypothetical protein [Acidobacteriota bacterium]
MKRVGFSDNYIAQLKAKGKTPSDFILVITEARGVRGQKPPTWNNVLDAATTHRDFAVYKRKFSDPTFFNKVQSPGYKAHFEEMTRLGLTDVEYAKRLPKGERGAFLFRNDMNRTLGVNEFFTGNGRTQRTDGKNKGVGVTEVLGKNDQVSSMQRNTYAELSETGKTDLRITDKTPTISDNPLQLRSEMRTGAIAGAGISAAFSLPQVFDQAGRGDYSGAAQTFATRTGGGALVGAASSAGERIIGNGIERGLSRSGTPLITSGVARQIISRVAGSSIIGGAVNGAFSAYDQIGAFKRGDVTGSQAIGTVVGEVGIGLAAGATGAAAGAAIL